MGAEEALRRLGGVASTAQLLELTTRRRLQTACVAGRVVRASRGRYVLPDVGRAREQAARWHAVVSGPSAALHHGWPVKDSPERPWLTVPRHRKVEAELRGLCEVLYVDLTAPERAAGVTAPVRTVLDCARRLPLDQALAVADSALRAGAVEREELLLAARALRGPGTSRARRVVAAASPLAANPFESVLRALCLDVPGLDLVPQVVLRVGDWTCRPDLVDRARRIVVEADSWQFHTDRQALSRDCVRYNRLSLADWQVLRFTWDQVMHSPRYVRGVVGEAAELAERRRA